LPYFIVNGLFFSLEDIMAVGPWLIKKNAMSGKMDALRKCTRQGGQIVQGHMVDDIS
jgi:hypothetical protein